MLPPTGVTHTGVVLLRGDRFVSFAILSETWFTKTLWRCLSTRVGVIVALVPSVSVRKVVHMVKSGIGQSLVPRSQSRTIWTSKSILGAAGWYHLSCLTLKTSQRPAYSS